MPSVFPSLFAFQLLAPFLLRITLSAVILYWTISKFKSQKLDTKKRIYNLVELIAGLSILIGAWMQIGVLAIMLILAIRLYSKFRNKELFSNGINYYFILFIIALSLLLTGPGIFAFDFPL
jgi:uncharacterized membrane protein YphA (DoxX/SURF4 family)